MLEELRKWLVSHLHEAHYMDPENPSLDVLRDSFADLKAAHDLLHESMQEEDKKSDVVAQLP